MKQHRLTALGLAAGLLAGGGAGLALGVPGFAGAQTTESTPGTSTPDSPTPVRQWMRDALAPLVDDGTVTQAQADAVIAALEEAKPAKGRGPGRRLGIRILRGLDTAAETLRLSGEELRTALRDGQSLADVAQEQGVDPERVVEALAAELKTRLDAAVAAGRLTQAEADEKLATATDRIRAAVDGELPLGRGHGRHRFGGPPAEPPAAAEPGR